MKHLMVAMTAALAVAASACGTDGDGPSATGSPTVSPTRSSSTSAIDAPLRAAHTAGLAVTADLEALVRTGSTAPSHADGTDYTDDLGPAEDAPHAVGLCNVDYDAQTLAVAVVLEPGALVQSSVTTWHPVTSGPSVANVKSAKHSCEVRYAVLVHEALSDTQVG